jgi:tetratricopeptide (TPR) repeat protein
MRLPLLALLVLAAAPAAADVPPLLVPEHADSVSTSTPAAPMIVPGRGPQGSPATRASKAREEFALGSALERQGNRPAAIAAYRTAVMLDPTLPEAHFRMGRLFAAVGQHRVAADEFARELEHHPDRNDARLGLAQSSAQSGDTTRAIAMLEDMTRRRPRDEPAWQALGFVYAVAGRPRDGERALRRALALDPKDADAWRDLGVVLVNQDRPDAARAAYRRAVELAPHDATAFVNLGNLERAASHWQAAYEAYAIAERIDSTQALAYRGQVDALTQLGRAPEAGDVYRRWLRVVPDEAALRMEAMRYFDGIGRTDIALELAREGVRGAPRSGEARLGLGLALDAAGQTRAALVELRIAEALFREPRDRGRVAHVIRGMRADAPDSLRALFAADSLADVASRAAADSTRARPRPRP